MTTASTLAFLSPGLFEIMVIGVVALLVFGGNLPDVMRNVGRTYAKFRQGLQDLSKPVREELRQVRELPQKAAAMASDTLGPNATGPNTTGPNTTTGVDDDEDRRNEGNEDLYAPTPSDTAPAENEPAGIDGGAASAPSEQGGTEAPDDDDLYGVADEPPPV